MSKLHCGMEGSQVMHPTSVFHWKDRAEMLAFVRARSFATLVDESLRVAQVPFIVDEAASRLLCHFSRGNPMSRALPMRVVAVVNGADAYVSPDWYKSHDQVPTWDYESVEIVGSLTPVDDTLLRDILAALSAEHEARIPDKAPWTMNKLRPATLDKMLTGIVGAALSIESIRGTQKLSQNKSDDDFDGVVAALERSPSQHDRDVAARMALVRRRRAEALTGRA
ncbi:MULTISPECIES: FMN-binding negative transcriptional regulator [Myxococcus]|nr:MULTISPECIES: FMN-binding negative transcriptional regulator [Myxococcus]UYI18045.1 FMN-binding negative transcriptional regulator [Myxococcus xanthus]UYI25497.1 FMN-binding negative transcriptional regulator [Myxococcus xanthus]